MRSSRLAADLTDAWNSHDPQRVAVLYAADYEGENIGEAAPHCGPEGLAASVATFLAAFPDLHFTVEDTMIQGERVVQVWRAHATHRGPLMNIPATNRRIAVRGASLLTFPRTNSTGRCTSGTWPACCGEIGLLPEL